MTWIIVLTAYAAVGAVLFGVFAALIEGKPDEWLALPFAIVWPVTLLIVLGLALGTAARKRKA